MNIEKGRLIYFSPTRTTRTVVRAIGSGTGLPLAEFDFTHLRAAPAPPPSGPNELAIIGLPVYMGRVPFAAVPYLRALEAEDTPCVLVGVYGNRAFDDFLVELEDISRERGFRPVAAAAFIGEHSITPALAAGRPDAADIALAEKFGADVLSALKRSASVPELAPGAVPGRRPYETYSAGKVKRDASEKIANGPTVGDGCTGCKACVDACPIDNINPRDVRDINPYECIRCHACVRACPVGAMRFLKPGFVRHVRELEELYSQPGRTPTIIL